MRKIKCHSCGTWNEGEHEKCEACNVLLDENRHRKEKRDQADNKLKINTEQPGVFEINEGDNIFIIAVKKIAQGAHFVFMAILSFIIWFIAIFSG